MAWTDDQKRAIHEYGYNIVDSAGAGSGKTAVLSERVKYFVTEKGFEISEFLILTFTKLAAGEMKERIRQNLVKANSPEAEFVPSADITTFDSFTNSLIKKYHYLLNLSPKVGIIDDTVMLVKKKKILEEMFEERYEKHDEEFEDLIRTFCYKNDDNIKDFVLSIQNKADLELDKENFLDTFVEKYTADTLQEKIVHDVIYEMIIPRRNKLLSTIENLPDLLIEKTGRDLKDSYMDLYNDYLNAEEYDYLVNTANIPPAIRGVKKEDFDPSELEKYQLFLDTKTSYTKFLRSLPSSTNEIEEQISKNKKYTKIMIELVKELDRKQYEYKKEMNVFSFQDIAKLALHLVRTNNDVKEALKNKYKMIMIDEYQDTSSLQEAFINEFSSNNVYMVGDIKQSIYAFRNAKSDIFANKYALYKYGKGGQVIDMNRNFRSRKEVLDDINKLFSSIMTLPLGGADYRKDHIIQFGLVDYLKAENAKQNNHAEFITYDKEKFNKLSKPEIEASIVAEDIINKINNGYTVFNRKKDDEAGPRPCVFSDFCIIISKGTDFNTFKKVFTRYKIPLFIEQNEDIKDNLIVGLLTNILKFVRAIKNNKYDAEFKLAYLSIARSFLYENKDEELYLTCKNESFKQTQVYLDINEVLNECKGLSLYEVINEILFKLDIYHKFIRIGNVNNNTLYLEMFMSYLKQMNDLDYSLDDFISYLEDVKKYQLKIDITSPGTTSNSVRLMNIHKSKGLEFPICYFPQITSSFNNSEGKLKTAVSSDYGLSFPTEENSKDIVKILSDAKRVKEDLSEKIRLLYVALTRAREKMIFITENEGKMVELDDSKSFDNILRPHMHEFKVNEVEELTNINLNIETNDSIEEKFIIDEIRFDYKEKEVSQVSKHLKLNTNNYLLEYGTYLHELMEVMDFINPDYSFIQNDKTKNIVKKFLESDLLKNVSKAKIYKEYAFENDDKFGIIDLFLVYEDHIDLIDYKTKNIKDDKYESQINVYRQFLERTFNKKVHGYLYSLIDGDFKVCKE